MCIRDRNVYNNSMKDPKEVEGRKERARRHLEFVVEMCRAQVRAGRYFVHEHPSNALSWQEASIRELLALPGVERIDGDQCQYGSEARRGPNEGEPIKKPTGFATNSPCIKAELGRRCSGHGGIAPGQKEEGMLNAQERSPKTPQSIRLGCAGRSFVEPFSR